MWVHDSKKFKPFKSFKTFKPLKNTNPVTTWRNHNSRVVESQSSAFETQ